MSDMAATACGRRWPCAARKGLWCNATQVRLPAFVDALRCVSASPACRGRARGLLALPPL